MTYLEGSCSTSWRRAYLVLRFNVGRVVVLNKPPAQRWRRLVALAAVTLVRSPASLGAAAAAGWLAGWLLAGGSGQPNNAQHLVRYQVTGDLPQHRDGISIHEG
jgi:hypothetical protein